MKHLLSICTILFLISYHSVAQTNEPYVIKTIKGKEYIIYQVKAGDTWESIAKKFNVIERNLIDANLQTNGSLKGINTIKVPATGVSITQTKTTEKEAPIEVNTLPKFGDDFKNADPKEVNTVDSTKKANKPTIYGQELRTEFRENNSLIVYKVGEGDNIKDIATYYNCTVSEITERNNITSEKLIAGKIIKIPLRKAPVITTPENKVEPIVTNEVTTTNETKSVENNVITENGADNGVKDIIDEAKIDIKSDLKPNETLVGEYVIVKKSNKLFIKHLVISGEDLTRIAKINYSTNSKIISANNLKTSKVSTGEILLVPTNKLTIKKLTGLEYEQVEKEKNKLLAKNSSNENKIVSNEETVAANINVLDNKNAVAKVETKTTSNDSLIRYNWGDKLIPTTSILDSNARKTIEDLAKNMNINEVHANSNPGETKASFTHIVQQGEKIEDIAKKYKISINDIANWNNLYQNRIRVGQDLIVNAERARKPYLALNSIDNKTINKIKKIDNSSRVKNVEEKGLCLFNNSKFEGVSHRSLPIGTLILITSTENYKKIYVRVTSNLESNIEGVIIQVDKNIAKQLAFNSELSNVYINYALVE